MFFRKNLLKLKSKQIKKELPNRENLPEQLPHWKNVIFKTKIKLRCFVSSSPTHFSICSDFFLSLTGAIRFETTKTMIVASSMKIWSVVTNYWMSNCPPHLIFRLFATFLYEYRTIRFQRDFVISFNKPSVNKKILLPA